MNGTVMKGSGPMRRWTQVLVVVIASVAALASTVTTASALPAGSSSGSSDGSSGGIDLSFYQPPRGPLPPAGTLIKAKPIRTFFQLPTRNGPVPAKATLIMYSTTNGLGKVVPVTGYYLEPSKPWAGGGARPIISYGPGAHGQGDSCAPSRVLQSVTLAPGGPMAEIESAITFDLVSRGYGLVSTDYIGLGMPGVHTFGMRVDQADAVIDAGRAVFGLPGVDPDSKVALAGYSQGGQAMSGAAELLESYAPEFSRKVVGIYAGGIPADLRKVTAFLDGRRLGGAGGLAINGAMALYPDWAQHIPKIFNAYGNALMKWLSNQCIVSVSALGSPKTKDWTKSGKSFGYLMDTDPILHRRVIEQTIGLRKPAAVPILLSSNPVDPTVPPLGGDDVFRSWCAKGPKSVEYRTIAFPVLGGTAAGHIAGGAAGFQEAIKWIGDRFAGKPAAVGCLRRPGVSNGLAAGSSGGGSSSGSLGSS